MRAPNPSGSDTGHGHAETEALLGVEDKEGRQRRVAEHPQRLGEQHLARPPGGGARCALPRFGPALSGGGSLAQPQAAGDNQRGHDGGRQHAGREDEGRRRRGLDQRAADGHRHHRAG